MISRWKMTHRGTERHPGARDREEDRSCQESTPRPPPPQFIHPPAPQFPLELREKRQQIRSRAFSRARVYITSLPTRSPRVSGGVCALGGLPGESVSVSRPSPSSVPDFLTLSLKASVSLRLSVCPAGCPHLSVPTLPPSCAKAPSLPPPAPRARPALGSPAPPPPAPPPSLARTLSLRRCLFQADLWSTQGLSLAER